MKLGTITVACKENTLEEKLDQVKAWGMDIWQPASPEIADIEPERLKDMVAQRGLAMNGLGAGVPMCNPAKLEENIENWKTRVAGAAALDISTVISRTFPKPEDVSDTDAWKASITCGKEMVRIASDHGCVWALETDSGNFVHSLETAVQLLDGVGSSLASVNYDPCNYYVGGGDDPLVVLDTLYDRIVAGHIKDGVRPEGEDAHETPVGEGDLDYVAIFSELLKRGFQGGMSIEHMKSFEQIEAAWLHTKACADQARNSLEIE